MKQLTYYLFDANLIFTSSVVVDTLHQIPINGTLMEPPLLQGSEVARWGGDAWHILSNYPAVPPTEPAVPSVVSMAQARKALVISQGIEDADVRTAINSIADVTERRLALIDWEFETTVTRASPLISSLGPVLGLTEEDIDALFILAATL